METLFDLGPAERTQRPRPARRLPVVVSAEQGCILACDEDEFCSTWREDLYLLKMCPVDPEQNPCPMVGCAHHVYSLTSGDERRSAADIAETIMQLPMTCQRQTLSQWPQGVPVSELAQLTTMGEQTIRDIEVRLFASQEWRQYCDEFELDYYRGRELFRDICGEL